MLFIVGSNPTLSCLFSFWWFFLAQLEEQLPSKQCVMGSIPIERVKLVFSFIANHIPLNKSLLSSYFPSSFAFFPVCSSISDVNRAELNSVSSYSSVNGYRDVSVDLLWDVGSFNSSSSFFKIYHGSNGSEFLLDYDLILPSTPYSEFNGLSMNMVGDVQRIRRVVPPTSQSKTYSDTLFAFLNYLLVSPLGIKSILYYNLNNSSYFRNRFLLDFSLTSSICFHPSFVFSDFSPRNEILLNSININSKKTLHLNF
jgi:hypothetical protein